MASMAYEGSPIRPSILQAAQNELDMARIARNKLPLAVEGSGIPDRVRRAAQAALEGTGRYAQGASQAAEAVAPVAEAGGRGILGRALGAVGGPIGVGIQAAVTPGDLGDAELTRAQQQAMASQAVQEMGPETAASANQWAEGVGQRAARAARGGPQGADLLTSTVARQPGEEKVLDTLQAGLDDAAQTSGVAAAEQEESNRQIIQQGAIEGLRSGAVSRPEMAKAVVDADAQRNGVELQPEERDKAVQEELTQMRTMDDSDLSRYVSYALIGTGLLASAIDKTGRAGDMFAESYNRQLDRNLQAGITDQKMKAAAAERQIKEKDLERKAAKDARDAQLAQANLAVKQGTLEQTERRTSGLLDRWAEEARRGQASLGLTQRGQDLATQRAQLQAETARRGQDISSENAQLSAAVRLKSAKLSAAARQAAGKAAQGEPLTTKDSNELVGSVSGTGILGGAKLGKVEQQAIGQKLRNYLRRNPGADPIPYIQQEAGKLQKNPTLFGFGSGILEYPNP